jgi:hypothetical protein
LAIPLSAGAEVGGPTQSQFIREDALQQREQGFMGHSTTVFEQQASSVVNEQALERYSGTREGLSAPMDDQFFGHEPFVDEEVIARFIGEEPRQVLEMARKGEIPAHPLGKGARHRWKFRISEVAAAISKTVASDVRLKSAVPGATRRKQ